LNLAKLIDFGFGPCGNFHDQEDPGNMSISNLTALGLHIAFTWNNVKNVTTLHPCDPGPGNRKRQVYPCPSKTVSASNGAGWRVGHASAVPAWEKAM